MFLLDASLFRLQILPRCLDIGIKLAFPGLDSERPHAVVVEYVVHLLQRLAEALLEKQEHMNQRRQAEGAENTMDPPLDILETRRAEECQSKVADPVHGRGKRHRFAADVERDDLRGI